MSKEPETVADLAQLLVKLADTMSEYFELMHYQALQQYGEIKQAQLEREARWAADCNHDDSITVN